MAEGALRGITIVEAATHVLGPMAAAMLGDQGADVIKVEGLAGDPARALREYAGYDVSLGDASNSIFEVMNRNKRGIAIDLESAAGRGLLRELLSTADGFIEGFGPGALAARGLSYESLANENPGLIYCGLSAMGPEGEEAAAPGPDAAAAARSGLMWMAGAPGSLPNWNNLGLGDTMGASMVAYGMVAAITARARGGTGQRLDVSQLMALAWLERWAVETLLVRGLDEWPRFDRENTRNPLFSHYRCGDGEWIILGIVDHERDWDPFCEAMGLAWMHEDERFNTGEARIANARALVQALDQRFAEEPRAYWEERLGSQRALVFDRVQRIRDLPRDPAVQANAYLQDVEHPRYGPVKMLTHPTLLTKTPAAYYRPAPELGQHTDEILRERLGYDDARIAALRAEGVIR